MKLNLEILILCVKWCAFLCIVCVEVITNFITVFQIDTLNSMIPNVPFERQMCIVCSSLLDCVHHI